MDQYEYINSEERLVSDTESDAADNFSGVNLVEQKSRTKTYLAIGGFVFVCLILGGVYTLFKTTAAESIVNDSIVEIGKEEQVSTQDQDPIQKEFNRVSIAELGIEFEYPTKWEVSDPYSGDFEGFTIDQVRVRPTQGDETPVWFFVVEATLEEAMGINLLKLDLPIADSQTEQVSLNGRPATKRETTLSGVSCTYVEYFLEQSPTVYGAQITKCDTNDVEYDGPRFEVVGSLNIIDGQSGSFTDLSTRTFSNGYPVTVSVFHKKIEDAGLGGKQSCDALIVSTSDTEVTEFLKELNREHYERVFGENYIDNTIGSDKFILLGWNWKRDLTENQREAILNSTPLNSVKILLEKLSDPGARGYDVCDLHESIKLNLVGE